MLTDISTYFLNRSNTLYKEWFKMKKNQEWTREKKENLHFHLGLQSKHSLLMKKQIGHSFLVLNLVISANYLPYFLFI